MKGFPSVIRIIDRTLKNIEREEVDQMKVSAAIITTGILCLEGLSSFTGSRDKNIASWQHFFIIFCKIIAQNRCT